MVSGNPPRSGADDRKPDELEQFLDFVRKMLEKWMKEPGTISYYDPPSSEPKFSDIQKSDFWKSLDENKMRAARLGVDPNNRNQVIEKIVQSVGKHKWKYLTAIFQQLPADFESYVRRPRELAIAKQRMAKQCRDLANLIGRNTLSPQTDIYDSPFHGLVAKQVFTIEWLWALQGLRCSRPTVENALNAAHRCFYGLYLTDAGTTIVKLLRGYADALDKWKPEMRVETLQTFAYGKLDEKQFVKRVVFFLLDKELNPDKRRGGAPNQETATIVNAILGLRGKNKVTANQITQMNKKTRTKYHKELETYVTTTKAQE